MGLALSTRFDDVKKTQIVKKWWLGYRNTLLSLARFAKSFPYYCQFANNIDVCLLCVCSQNATLNSQNWIQNEWIWERTFIFLCLLSANYSRKTNFSKRAPRRCKSCDLANDMSLRELPKIDFSLWKWQATPKSVALFAPFSHLDSSFGLSQTCNFSNIFNLSLLFFITFSELFELWSYETHSDYTVQSLGLTMERTLD